MAFKGFDYEPQLANLPDSVWIAYANMENSGNTPAVGLIARVPM